ncbi:hypothetical protein F5I97DRAFT_1875287 [Phlebopus sp. FC_14]|nr:hypothetical protein F5I97DRAFT_1875287 [Phlebopus sp. FC_14]
MPFPFTFNFSVPGLHNPFLAEPGLGHTRSESDERPAPVYRQTSHLPPPRISSCPSLSPPVPLARKRGWVPSTPEPSQAATDPTSTRGYLDTPAKYRDMPESAPEQETEGMIAELPPAKRRRTLAGSIVSTALSAALIGTAVGLTVYRLWRDRGKEPHQQLPPPPPYQPGNWVPQSPKQIEVVPPTPTPKNRKSRHAPTSARRIPARQQRRPRARIPPITPPRSVSPAFLSPPRPEFDLVHVNGHVEEADADGQPEEDEMDWIGDRLSKLIEEGKRALGREIVVMSDSKEDEVDDGSGGWEEDEPATSTGGPSISRRGSMRSLRRTHRPRDLPLPPSYAGYPSSPPASSSPRKRRFETESIHQSPGCTNFSALPAPSTPRRFGRGVSVESDICPPITSSFREDESAWESPMVRESMAKARAQYLQNRKS